LRPHNCHDNAVHNNSQGLGNGSANIIVNAENADPVYLGAAEVYAVAIYAGGSDTCVILNTEQLLCFGSNAHVSAAFDLIFLAIIA
jgi:hypothetical protein